MPTARKVLRFIDTGQKKTRCYLLIQELDMREEKIFALSLPNQNFQEDVFLGCVHFERTERN